jgi:hypothetical protein
MVRVIEGEGYLKEPQARVPLGVLFCGNRHHLAKRKEPRWRFRVAWLGRRSCVLRSEQYRRYAQASLELARNAEDQRTQASLLHMAQVWVRLAEEHVNEADERQSAES